MEVKEHEQNISGLSFRDLSIDSNQSKEGGDFIFLDSDISDDADLSRMRKFFRLLTQKFNSKKGVLAFFIDFAEYIFSRLRIVWVLFSVLFEILFKQFDSLKNSIVRKMFWGRGSFLKYIVQTATVIIASILAISYVYRAPTITSANEEDLDYISVA